MRCRLLFLPVSFLALLFLGFFAAAGASGATGGTGVDGRNPFREEVLLRVGKLRGGDAAERQRAAEALGYMRAAAAVPALVTALADASPAVRRAAALSLGWCGTEAAAAPALAAVAKNDRDWAVRRSAEIALENLRSLAALSVPAALKVVAPVTEKVVVSGQLPVARGKNAKGRKAAEKSKPAPVLKWRQITDADEKVKIQTAIRALGRAAALPAALPAASSPAAASSLVPPAVSPAERARALEGLLVLLRNPQWTRYAADALGEFAQSEGVSPAVRNRVALALLAVFPPHARHLDDKVLRRETPFIAQAAHPSDHPHLDSRDRIFAAAYAVLFALSRFEFDGDALAALRKNAPLIAQQIPLDIDRLVFYEEEPFQKITRALLSRCGERERILEHAFAVLEATASLPPPAVAKVPAVAPENRQRGAAAGGFLASMPRSAPFNANVVAALCREREAVPRLIELLDHRDHWVRINAAKTLLFIGDAPAAVPALRRRLAESRPEASFGEFAAPPHPSNGNRQGQGEFNDPTPRHREALIMALGGLRDAASVPALAAILNDPCDENSLGIRHRAAFALGQIGTAGALDALRLAERDNPFHSIRIAAREELWRHGVAPLPAKETPPVVPPAAQTLPAPRSPLPQKIVFIKGAVTPPNNPFQMDPWRQCYMTTDSGPVYRPGDNLFVLDTAAGTVSPLTRFTDGYVGECEVSYDGRVVWFTRRERAEPWWHIWRVNADGSGLAQVTRGRFHDVSPVELPDGRIAFASTRLGTRDEYHGYPCTGLCVMRADGSDIQNIGFNFGRDAEPSVGHDGRILFTRLELFYSRMKTEFNLLAVNPDGTRAQTLYGPERRGFWAKIAGGYGGWFAGGDMSPTGARHRVLRLTQPQPFYDGQVLLTTPAGPVLTQGRHGERLLREKFLRKGGNDPFAITGAFPLDRHTLLVAAGEKPKVFENAQFPKDGVAHAICTLDVATGELTRLHAEPGVACFEPRPLRPRARPPALPDDPAARTSQHTGSLYCQSVFHTQDERVRRHSRLLRVVEALPQVTRHATHTIPGEFAWKNHGGAFARDLAIVPLAPDGSFALTVPADKFLALQVLDADRNVVGNQLVWINVRPGEQKGCVGCHERPDTAVPAGRPQALALPFQRALPAGAPYNFHAKAWFKGSLSDEREERQRTVQSANWFGRP